MNVVVVSIQSNSSKRILLFADWFLPKTTFVLWDILWAMMMTNHTIPGSRGRLPARHQHVRALREVLLGGLSDGPLWGDHGVRRGGGRRGGVGGAGGGEAGGDGAAQDSVRRVQETCAGQLGYS